jgi:legumain
MGKLVFALLLALAAADKWALLIAGSNGYGNYRHQSDICHMYQLLHNKGGFPEDHVIVMMYDDIANNAQNPVKNNLINKPNGPNVYPGVPHDYTGNNVNKQQFLAALSGDDKTTHGRKVIKSTEDDEIFVYYSDHGSTGLIAMPSGDYLYSNELMNTLKSMASQKKFKQLVFYLEACESGSMFANILPSNINIYATTAANPSESSYAYYYDSSRRTYLGDEYSVKFMEDDDDSDYNMETFQQQYVVIKNATKGSHVCQYGDMSISKQQLSDFLTVKNRGRWTGPLRDLDIKAEAVDSRDVKLALLTHQFEDTNDVAEKLTLSQQIAQEKAERALADTRFGALWTAVAGNKLFVPQVPLLEDAAGWRCYQNSVRMFEAKCGKLTDYSLKHAKTFSTLCAQGFAPEKISSAIFEICA